MKTLMNFGIALLLVFAFSCSTESEPDELIGVSAKASGKQMTSIGGLGGITGTSTLHRNKNGITVNFKAEGLHPGAYTIWWVIWNNPQDCATPGECNEGDFATPVEVEVEVMYAGGHVVGKNGKGNFSAHLKAGDDSPESMNESFGFPSVGGLTVGNTFGAEVHVVLRTHGPVVPGLVNEQISTYRGGCDEPFLYAPFTVYPNAIGECADIAAAVFAPAN
ncbi:hypothetical protein [uncultured Muriicola sp.]|uniref:hypothetical protein n=1 Tax=uncultured Muriicola sp. TaxID=1583102 RepID=UPI002633C306|nr:hypothetical protein [uncultured Muriicola sp.]